MYPALSYIFLSHFQMPDFPTFYQSGTGMKNNANQSGIRMLRQRTEMPNAGMPVTAASVLIPLPSAQLW
jgi:hypothetical protein